MKKIILSLVVISLLLSFVACTTNTHVIGRGAQNGVVEKQTQWYILFGLIPLNDVDTNTMAQDATDYTITTKFTFVDILISGFTSIVTIQRRNVAVEK